MRISPFVLTEDNVNISLTPIVIPLTPTERNVLVRLAYTNNEIALILGVKERTIRNAINRIAIKFGIPGRGVKRVKILIKALMLGVLTLDEIHSGESAYGVPEYFINGKVERI